MMSTPQYQHLVAQLDSELGESENKAQESSISRPSKPTRQKVILTSGLELNPRPVRWLWKDWLALGKMHILAGAPGQGKTTIALACAAIVSKGGFWPDSSTSESGNILIWSGEDDPADTLLPRLLMAGADRARCYFVSGTRINGEEHSFDPARDMADLEAEAIRLGGIKLIVVDPVVSAVAGDGNKNNDVRRALQPLVDLASKLDAAVIGISHFSKAGQGGDPATRVVGSVAFTAVARVVLVAAKVKSEDGDTKRILARGKSNIGPDEGGFEYHIEQGEPIPGIVASFVTWGKAVEGSARELFAENERVTENAPDKTARENAEEFLIQLLKEGICPSRYVEAQAKEAGLSWATVKRASQSLGLKKRKVNESWYWERPNLLNQLAQDAQLAKSEQVEQVDEQVDPGSPYAEVSLDQNFSDEF
jgi:putative DNA primase/helicase